MRNCNRLYQLFKTVTFFSIAFIFSLSLSASADASCWITLTIKNDGCATGKVYKYEYGKYTYMRDLHKGQSVKVNAQKGSEWLISDGKVARKSHKVSNCYDHSMKFDLGGCSTSSGGDSSCKPVVKFKNSHCGALSIHKEEYGKLTHLATITPHSHWNTEAPKGSIWVVKEGHKEMKRWKVPSCYSQTVDLKFGDCHTTSTDCKAKLIFKNQYCHSLKIYHKSNGHNVLKKELAPNAAWGTYSKIGHEWVVRKGYTTLKSWKVPNCNNHTIALNFSGCGSDSAGGTDCKGTTTFYNKNCTKLSLYKEHQGRLYHRKDLASKSHWSVPTTKGENWVVKEGHTVKKNWTSTSCNNESVHLDFGGCHSSHGDCTSLLGFYNDDCERLSIYKDAYGKLTHMKDLNYKGYWRTQTHKGQRWVIKKGDEVMKNHQVSTCYNVNLKLEFGGCAADLCGNGEEKKAPGTKCNDYDSHTHNDVIQDDGCTCAGEKTTTSNDCEKSYTDFEHGWGDWYDGGSNCVRYKSSHGPMAGHHAIRIRDNKGWSSSTYSVAYNMTGHTSATVDFMYMTTGMKYGAIFALEYSTNDGKTWYKARKWEKGVHYVNNKVYNASVTFKAYFGRKTRFRIRSYASGASSYVHLDNIKVTSCHEKGFNSDADHSKLGKSQNTKISELSIFPNPVSNVMTVSGLSEGESYQIFDIAGREVMQGLSEAVISISNLQSGTYLIRTQNGEVKKFIKK